MFNSTAIKDINVSADTAWSLVADWGNTSWLSNLERTEVEIAGEQVTRRLFISGAPSPVIETMVKRDDASRTLHYVIQKGDIFTLKDYSGRVTVHTTDDGCRVEWYCTFDQASMSDEEANTVAQGNMAYLLGNLKNQLEQ